MSLKTIESQEVFNWIMEKRNDFQIVDLRREDFPKGHIKNSWNYPVQGEMTNITMDNLVARLLTSFNCEDATKVIFHCTSSKNRGPRTAIQFNRYCTLNGLEKKMEGYVLVGGYNKWKDLFEHAKMSTICVE